MQEPLTESTLGGVRAQKIAVLEIGSHTVKAVKICSLGSLFVLEDYKIESLAEEEGKGKGPAKPKPLHERVLEILRPWGEEVREVAIIANQAGAFNLIYRPGESNKPAARLKFEQVLLQERNLRLSEHVWATIPLRKGATDGESANRAGPVMICGDTKSSTNKLVEQLQREGYQVRDLFFQAPCLLKAFEFFGGPLLQKQTVALLHLTDTRYTIIILAKGVIATIREAKLAEGAKAASPAALVRDVSHYLASLESMSAFQFRCIFVSGDRHATEECVSALRQAGRYARPWNTIRRCSVLLSDDQRQNLLEVGSQLNSVAGACLLALEQAPAFQQLERQTRRSGLKDALVRNIAAPLAACACLLLIALVWLHWGNKAAAAQLAGQKPKVEQRAQPPKAPVAASVAREVQALESFANAQVAWAQILDELTRLTTPEIELLEIHASSGIAVVDAGPFAKSAKGAPRKSVVAGSIWIEARNTGGLSSLEDFISSIRNNPVLRPMLNKRQPVRLVKNIERNDSDQPSATVVTLELALQERNL